VEGSGSPSNCEPPPGQKYTEASIILVYFICFILAVDYDVLLRML
jgi:hypothetical protein